MHLLYLH